MKKKIAVVYPYVPHYRRPVFRALASNRLKYRYVVFAGRNTIDASIQSDLDGDGYDLVQTGIYSWKGLTFQSGVLRKIFDVEYAGYIFLGSPYFITTWIYAALARLKGKKVFFWTHGWIRERDGFLNSFLRGVFYRLSNSLLLYGSRAKKIGISKGFDVNRLDVIFNSLDYLAQREQRKLIESGVEPIAAAVSDRVNVFRDYFACISRLTQSCKFELAIDALAEINATRGVSLLLVLIGEGDQKSFLEHYAAERNVELTCLGGLYHEKAIAPILYYAKAVVSPGKVGLTAMHSLAYGTPVITHDNYDNQGPECEALEHRVTGSFFSEGSVGSLKEEIEYWLDNKDRSAIRTSCIGAVESKYTPEVQVALIEEVVQRHCG